MDRIRRMHREEKLNFRKWVSKRYYDRPDGQDIYGKLSYTTKMAAAGGTFCGYAYSLFDPVAIDLKTKILKISRVLIPSIGMAVAFTCVTYYSTNYRKKDDQLNYVLGGAAAGLLLGPATGAASVGIYAAMVLGALGYAKKSAHMKHQQLIPTIRPREYPKYLTKHWFITLEEDTLRGNWVKGPPTN